MSISRIEILSMCKALSTNLESMIILADVGAKLDFPSVCVV
jgi:hypothetical protein